MYIKHFLNLLHFSIIDIFNYMRCSEGKYNKEERADYVLAVASHTIEKGLGCVEYKKDWGKEKVKRICNLIEKYIESGYQTDKYGFLEALAVCEEYVKHKKSQNEDISEICEKLDKIYKKLNLKEKSNYKAGKQIYEKNELILNIESVEKIFNYTKSVRNYSEKEVKEEDIIKAIEMCKMAPSACNRQPIRFYYSLNKDKVELVDKIVPGNSSIKGKTPNFIIVTASISQFSVFEYGQWYVNGGIYLGYLRIALQSCGIGNCIYQWTINENEDKLRESYKIPKNEKIIAIVGIGYLPEKAHCISSQRKDIKEILIKS